MSLSATFLLEPLQGQWPHHIPQQPIPAGISKTNDNNKNCMKKLKN